ncbi:MAG TPA: GlsB/YeaQ/YmgE family stress response membrane protein [Fimbriimonas sp.]
MDIVYLIVIGLLAGIIAKALTPGTAKEPKGCLMTMALGIAGSLLVGFIVRTFLGGGAGGFVPTLVGATIGAILLILLMRKFWK